METSKKHKQNYSALKDIEVHISIEIGEVLVSAMELLELAPGQHF